MNASSAKNLFEKKVKFIKQTGMDEGYGQPFPMPFFFSGAKRSIDLGEKRLAIRTRGSFV